MMKDLLTVAFAVILGGALVLLGASTLAVTYAPPPSDSVVPVYTYLCPYPPSETLNASVTGPSSGLADEELAYNFTYCGEAADFMYSIGWGDSPAGGESGGGNCECPQTEVHTYRSVGTFLIQFWVNDSSGGAAYASTTVHISAPPTDPWQDPSIWVPTAVAGLLAATAVAGLVAIGRTRRTRPPTGTTPSPAPRPPRPAHLRRARALLLAGGAVALVVGLITPFRFLINVGTTGQSYFLVNYYPGWSAVIVSGGCSTVCPPPNTIGYVGVDASFYLGVFVATVASLVLASLTFLLLALRKEGRRWRLGSLALTGGSMAVAAGICAAAFVAPPGAPLGCDLQPSPCDVFYGSTNFQHDLWGPSYGWFAILTAACLLFLTFLLELRALRSEGGTRDIVAGAGPPPTLRAPPEDPRLVPPAT